MKIVVLGTGFVASAYLRALHHLGFHPLVLSRAWLDYTDAEQLSHALAGYQPELVINAAGYTGRTVDDCQGYPPRKGKEPARVDGQKNECYQTNVVLARTVGRVCAARKIKLIHISSGCIFNGPGPFREEDTPNMTGQHYATCKFHGELAVLETGATCYIFRIRMPFNQLVGSRNWLSKLASYPRILDGLNSVTFLDEFAMRSFSLVVSKAAPGIYHGTYSTPVRTAQVAQALLEAGLRKEPVVLWDPAEFLAAGHCPRSEAVLDSSKFERALGVAWGDPLAAIRWCIENFGIAKLPPRGAEFA